MHYLAKSDILDSAPIIVMYLTNVSCETYHNVRIVRILELLFVSALC